MLAIDWRTAGTLGWNWRGYPWREGSIWRNGFNTLLTPNKPCYRPGGEWWELVTPVSSYHPGGVPTSIMTITTDVETEVGASSTDEEEATGDDEL